MHLPGAPLGQRLPVEDEAEVRDSFHLENFSQASPQERRRTDQGAFCATALLVDRVDRSVDGEMNARVAVVDGQDDRGDPHVRERGIRHVIAKEGAKLFEDDALQTRVPMPRRLFLVSHDQGHERIACVLVQALQGRPRDAAEIPRITRRFGRGPERARFRFTMKTKALLGFLVVAGMAACRSTAPQSPETGLTNAVQTPQPPDLGRGATRVKAEGAYHVFVADPVRNVCSGSVPFFDFDSSDTRGADQPTMQTLADCMIKGPLAGKSIKLVGHTDPRGAVGYNEKLGLERADRVKEYLVTHGVDASRVQVESAGETQASAEPKDWPKDRRVEVQLVR